MKRALIVSLIVVALLPSLLVYRSFLPEVMAAPLLSHKLDTIEPVTADWPQKEDNWCGAAVLQAYIDYAWRFHHGDENHYYTQSSIWDVMRDFTSSHFFAKGSRGIGAALPGQVGDAADEVRRLNIAYDFGVDPSALTWMMQYYGHDYYHFAIYRDGLYHATRWLLWTVEHHQEPVVAVVLHGSHYVLVIGYEAERSAVDPNGPGEISKVRYADPLLGSGEDAYKWRPWDSIWPWVDTWEEFFTEYTAQGDPDPSTGWYVPPPDLWQGGRVTVERDEDPDTIDYSPDWAVDGDNWSIIEHHDVTYLPDVKADWAEWNSTIVVRNNGSSDASASVIFYDSGGYGAGTSMRTARDNSLIPAGGTWELDASTAVNNFTGSAIVSASKDVSVVVETQHTDGRAYAYNGVASHDPLNPGWGQVGSTDIYLPILMDNNSGWNTETTMLNVGSEATCVYFTYYDLGGNPAPGFPLEPGGCYHLEPNASFTYQQAGSYCPIVGSAHLTSIQPLAVIVTEHHSSFMAYNGFSAGATTAHLPLLMANNSGWWTGIHVQNLGSVDATVTVHYYPEHGSSYPTRTLEILGGVKPNATAIFLQSGGQWGSEKWVGSAWVTADQPIVASVNELKQTGTEQGMSYSGFLDGTGLVVIPDVRYNVGGWTSSVSIQNLDGTAANVVIRVNGNQTWSGSIDAHKSRNFYPVPGIGSGFQGPVTVECTNGRRIVTTVNNLGSGGGDRARNYNGVNR